jgi:hypothetical protein
VEEITMILGFLKSTRDIVRDINEKYAVPQIPMTRRVRLALGLLRGYLLFLVGLIVYKFIITALHR